ncbi:MAG: 30S ribosomal protein S2, partial [Alphaproteobacteria bacterium]|nr:30S ribosomal protein S2 [Alphaproteobacteria bacterium]
SRALQFLNEIAASGGRILFVGTKMQARETIKITALDSGQYFVNHRWLGGMITNWQTILNSITNMKKLQKQLSDEDSGLTKKELITVMRKKTKLELVLGGISEMGSQPDVLFVVDINKEATAIAEAKVLNIPVVAIIDTNCNPDGIDYPIYGNDDSLRAIKLYCRLAKEAILDGMKNQMSQMGVDLGADANPDTSKDTMRARKPRPNNNDKPRGDKPRSDKPRGDKPRSDKPRGDKPRYDKPRSDKPKAEQPKADAKADAPKTVKAKAEQPQATKTEKESK